MVSRHTGDTLDSDVTVSNERSSPFIGICSHSCVQNYLARIIGKYSDLFFNMNI